MAPSSVEEALELLKDRFGELIRRVESHSPRQTFLWVDPPDMVEVARFLFHDMEARFATATGIDERDCVEVLYHWCLDPAGAVVTVRTSARKPALRLPSVGREHAAVRWIEREISDLLGVEFEGHPNPERLILADDWPEGVYPLRRDYRE